MNKDISSCFLLLIVIFSSCRGNETLVDYSNYLEGEWDITRIGVAKFEVDSGFQFTYNLKDSAHHISELKFKKLDPENVNVFIKLSRSDGSLLYEYSFNTGLLPDIEEKNLILFAENSAFVEAGIDIGKKEILMNSLEISAAKGEYGAGSSTWIYGNKKE